MRGLIVSNAVVSVAVLIGPAAGPALTAVRIETVWAGHPGNAADQNYYRNGQFGAVSFSYMGSNRWPSLMGALQWL